MEMQTQGPMTAKQIFKAIYSDARKQVLSHERAFGTIDRAEHELIHDRDQDIGRVIKIGRAALYAIHWQFFCGHLAGQFVLDSERHKGFVADENGTTTFFCNPRLPG